MDEDITLEEDADGDGQITPDVVKKLREKLKKCEMEKSDYLAGWQRAKADFINARKEEEESRGHFVKFSEMNLILELLNILDSFEEMFKSNPGKGNPGDMQGIQNIYKQLLSILQKRGVKQIECLGKEFNPEEHEAVGEIKVDGREKENIIMNEISKGYKLHGRVIRPSKVEVGRFK